MTEKDSSFEALEDKYQSSFDNFKLEFQGKVVINVTLLRFRNVSVSYFRDWVDTPDPQFRVTCPNVAKLKLRTFITRQIDSNTTSGTIDQTFKFVDSNASLNPSSEEAFPIIIKLYDLDVVKDDFIGKQEINATSLKINGEQLQKTLIFGKNKGELDVVISREYKPSPDFRFSLGLCSAERAFRKKRMPIVYEAMNKVVGPKQGPQNLQETPVVSLVCSGGGFRAVIGMCGAMEALTDAGLLDTITYTCGLSGSAWYLSAAYALQGISEEKQDSFHEGLKERFTNNVCLDLVSPFSLIEYQKHRRRKYKKYGQPHTFVNYFPGFLVGKQLLGDKNHVKLSELTPNIEEAKVPYPIFSALHVKNNVTAGVFHAYMERSPHEIYMPNYGIGFRPQQEGSVWSDGVLVRERPEYTLDFTIGMTGCAFAILLNAYLRNGGEKRKDLLSFIEQKRIRGRASANEELDGKFRSAIVESSDDEDDELEEENETYVDGNMISSILSNREKMQVDEPTAVNASGEKTEEAETPDNEMGLNCLFTSRNALIGRTARINNFVLGLNQVKRYYMNPFGVPKIHEGEAKEIIDAIGVRPIHKKISTKTTNLSFIDAGILKNVPTDAVLRPQRTTDIMIVMDFNGYESDDSFNYLPLLSAAAHAWQSGLKFPNINFEKVTNLPPKEFLIFPSDEEGCPTVLWFTLSNKKFKKLREYNPRSNEKPPYGEKKRFNDFDVFGGESFSSTFALQYSNYNFDQLRELMYYNVTSHIEDIKEAFISATKKKQEQLFKQA